MRPIMAAWLIVALMVAGCTGTEPPTEGSQSSPSAGSEQPRASPSSTETMQPAPSNTYPTNLPWESTSCRQVSGAIDGTATYIQENLPDPYVASGQQTAALTLLAQRCDALTLGNETLLEDVSLGLLYAFVQKTNDSTERPEAFVFETIVSDPALRESLTSYGWNAELGTIDIGQGPVVAVTISTSTFTYEATLAREGTYPEPLLDYAFLLHAGAPEKSNMLFDIHVTADDGLADPGLLVVDGGVLAEAIPAGVGTYRSELIEVNTRSLLL